MTEHPHLKAIKAAFPQTIPIFAGFSFIGIAYGIYMHSLGFPPIYAMLMSLLIFAGSMEFVAGSLLLVPFNPLSVFVLTLMLNSRHLFYGISMLDRFKGTGKYKPYLIFGMCDETFVINNMANVPKNVDKTLFMFYVTLLNQFYWFFGTTIGSLFGVFIKFDTKGLDFVMVALFVVIFLESWLKEKNHVSSLIGLAIPIVCLVIFGPNQFILPSMILIVLTLTILRGYFARKGVA
ncbi:MULTISPECIES: AzlC family ABC transporter permease [Staphylococcus]|uniref:AzlC family ABC transporter permease n=1 Tax=Staphylococcus TaxID=1279 RepID=UPI000764304A|nr:MULTISPECIES: AzlC family ABC transporter permease [Staphylococcus]KXA46992.1 putative azaleucine resistance protein AzlC [Staphylococcus simulans]OFM14049.1 branched-chain amino acid ABC transporter permease [Staphylococcus sp. HMSC059E03]OFN19292.1 branched-chain amino acid ABC transporter permease [Staphylococcus sp. HMSC055C03]OFU76499.1 branched-chain amino acid ABC transporter permease [Staphylococcus sp. HMSC10C03]OFV08276.1 branched-chain amino acid ABC transporter permease [Staphyl